MATREKKEAARLKGMTAAEKAAAEQAAAGLVGALLVAKGKCPPMR